MQILFSPKLFRRRVQLSYILSSIPINIRNIAVVQIIAGEGISFQEHVGGLESREGGNLGGQLNWSKLSFTKRMIRLRNAPSLALMNGLRQCECHVNPFAPADERVLRSYAVYRMHFVRRMHSSRFLTRASQSNSFHRNIRRVSRSNMTGVTNSFFFKFLQIKLANVFIHIPYLL